MTAYSVKKLRSPIFHHFIHGKAFCFSPNNVRLFYPSLHHLLLLLIFLLDILPAQLVGTTTHKYRSVGVFRPRVIAFNVLGNVSASSESILVQVPPVGLKLEKEYVTRQGTETRFKGGCPFASIIHPANLMTDMLTCLIGKKSNYVIRLFET